MDKKVKGKEESEFLEDDVDMNTPVDPKIDVCALCKGNHFFGTKIDSALRVTVEIDDEDEETTLDESILDKSGIWALKYSLSDKKRLFVHFFCAFYSPRTWFTGEKWHNLRREISRSSLTCRHCNKRGATLGCYEPRCNAVYHIPCAMELGFRPQRLSTRSNFYCSDHQVKRKREDLQLDHAVQNDISKGREVISIACEDIKILPDDFVYIKKNVDSDDVLCTLQNVQQLDCCTCTGLCNDVNICRCIRKQRNYTPYGQLMSRTIHPIVECNMRCSCNIRRCTNRVVEKGIQFELQLFRKRSRTETPLKSTEWSVRTLENIPMGSMVCEVVGQYRTLGDALSSRPRGHDKSLIFDIQKYENTEKRIRENTNRSESNQQSLDRDAARFAQRHENDASEVSASAAIVDSDEEFDTNATTYCIDCRYYGNIARFLKKRAGPPMLIPRLIYTNYSKDDHFNPKQNSSVDITELELNTLQGNLNKTPKLAYFAAVDIPANSELFL